MKAENSLYVQYGCGLSCPNGWLNFDVSPSLRLQHVPLLGSMMHKITGITFPNEIRYGDIIRGLPGVDEESCAGLYCSHVLEHLSLDDCRKALKNTYKLLHGGGIFRCVLPDLEQMVRGYVKRLDRSDPEGSILFIKYTLMGWENRPQGFFDRLRTMYQNHHHLWMWDEYSLGSELKKAGFTKVRRCKFGDCNDSMFQFVEDESRFKDALALEAVK